MLEGLQLMCEVELSKEISFSTLITLYELAYSVQAKYLKLSCIIFAKIHYQRLIDQDILQGNILQELDPFIQVSLEISLKFQKIRKK